VRYPAEIPLNNLFLPVLESAGLREEALADSTGKLIRLAELPAQAPPQLPRQTLRV